MGILAAFEFISTLNYFILTLKLRLNFCVLFEIIFLSLVFNLVKVPKTKL